MSNLERFLSRQDTDVSHIRTKYELGLPLLSHSATEMRDFATNARSI